MEVKKILIGARKLDFETSDGSKISGTQVFLVNDADSAKNRIPEKVFINGNLQLADYLNTELNKESVLSLVPCTCEVDLVGSKVKYNNIIID